MKTSEEEWKETMQFLDEKLRELEELHRQMKEDRKRENAKIKMEKIKKGMGYSG